ncbi:MAG: GNAT family N-acetyltransferase [Candidatus Omnitrophica bacterium]|nr:GNAT family N-acetyltransferase [Candidatus Omnitrophota bacterium]MBD3268810.1 GNAT family N-acetyltransferase [Candidatus Omnitrophota bacterium]
MSKNNFEVEIREMIIDDIPSVFHLGEKLFTPQDFPNLYRTWDEYEVVSYFTNEPELCMVACIKERVVGFVMGYSVEKARSAWSYGHLVWLGVAEDYQRMGVAQKLFNRFRDKMEEDRIRILLIDTQADNLAAIKFFKKQGFSDPTEHVYLALNLDESRR